MRTIAAIVLLMGLCGATACGSREPDRVVQARLKCSHYLAKGGTVDLSGDPCLGDGVLNPHLEIQVRTDDGKTYTVEEAPDFNVSVGDIWPPEK